MKYRKLSLTLLCLSLLTPSIAKAHDPSQHKGKGSTGEIVSIAENGIELKSAKGVQIVTITDKTTFERGSEKVTKADLKKGDQVTVLGTKLATGELVAREILLAIPEHRDGHKEKAGHKH